MAEPSSDPVRIDKWLWAARLAKTRPLAAEVVKGGHVELNGRRIAPGKGVRVGDRLDLTIGSIPRTVIVRGLAERRGPASVATTLYVEPPESIAERERIVQQQRLERALEPRVPGGGARPTKRDRRRLDAASAASRSDRSARSGDPARRTRRGRR
jgi:ribosome-associated heat shock protein Hsp15